jgi:hypothetical protein
MVYSPVYTVELQEALLNSGGRPALIYSTLVDIEKSGTGYTAHFESFIYPFLSLELRCGRNLTKRILASVGNLSEQNYAVVAKIDSLSRLRFSVMAHEVGDEPEVFVDTVSPMHVARGECLDILYVGPAFRELVFDTEE